MVAAVPGLAMQVTVAGWNNALYRLWLDRSGSQTAENSWLSAYDVPERVVREFGDRVRAEMRRLAGVTVAGG